MLKIVTRKILPYNPKLTELARRLRNNSTPGEILLWKQLRNKQILGFDFHRQKPITEYIVDFYCNELMLAIEIDGISHENPETLEKDLYRQNNIESLGISFLRFKESDVNKDIRSVVEAIEYWIKAHTPNPSR